MKSFIKNTYNGLNHILRIQHSSALRNKNLYPQHFYEIICRVSEIYLPGSITNIEEKKLIIFGNEDFYFLTNNSDFRYKKTVDGENIYLDIALTVGNNYSNIDIEVKTIDEGSVSFFRDSVSTNDYTRINYLSTFTGCLYKGNITQFIAYQTTTTIMITKGNYRITNITTGDVVYVRGTNLYNNSHESMTVSLTDIEDDYMQKINIYSADNGWYLIESL